MSDYLWDKTGEADPEVVELENLLGTLRHNPRPLRLPDELPSRRASARPRLAYSWTRMAVAASLLAALLAGAWALLSRQHATAPGVREVAGDRRVAPPGPPQAVTNATGGHQPPPDVQPIREQIAGQVVGSTPRRNERRARGTRSVNVRRGDNPRRRALPSNEAPRAAEIANNTITPEEAQRQLLLALQITSANLKYAQQQVREISGDSARR